LPSTHIVPATLENRKAASHLLNTSPETGRAFILCEMRNIESAVTALRSAIREHDESTVAMLIDEVLRHSDVEVDAVAARFCLPPEDLTALRRRVHLKVRDAVVGSEAMWEHRFRAAATRIAMREARDLDRTPEKTMRLLRAADRADELTPVGMLTGQLLKMTEPGIHAVANSFRFDLERRNELRRRVHLKVWQKVTGDDEFWERRFGLALKRVAINEARSISRQPTFEYLADEDPRLEATLETTIEQHLRASDVGRCLEVLPPRLKQAVELRYFKGLPIEAADNATETVSNRLGVSARQVRNHLREAEALLGECLSSSPARLLG
jgi:hypothetical protein